LVLLVAAWSAAGQVEPEEVGAEAPEAQAGEAAPAAENAPLLELDDLAADDAGEALPVAFRARPLHGLPAGMAALMVGGREGGQVALAPLAMPVLMPGDATAKAAVALLVEIDGRSLLGPDPPPEPEVQIYAYALNPRNEVAGFLAQAVVLDLTQVGEAVFVGGLKFTGHLELAPGDYTLRLLVHEPASQRFGLAKVEVSVPQRAALLTPLVAESPEAPWLIVGEAQHGDMGALDLGRALALAGAPMPSALPLLRGDEARVDLLVYGAAGAALPDPLPVRAEDLEGRPAGELPARVLGREATGLPGIERLRLGVPLTSLESGSYLLRAAAPSLGGAESVSAALPAVVLRGSSTDELWTDIQHRLSGDTAIASLDLEEVARRRRGRQQRVRETVADAYRQALQRLADGDRAGALAGLVQVEREVLSSGQEAPLTLLLEAERMVLDALAAYEPQALLPVANLHGRAYDHYRENLDFGLSTHARETSIATAERFAAEVRQRAGRRGRRAGVSAEEAETAQALASDSLAAFGAYLQTAQVRTTGRALLRRALELDPDNRSALIHLATGLEKTGDYDESIRVLERLVAADPKSPEGRLRLAVNHRRLGRTGPATALLRDLVREDNPPWVLAVAYQELASMLLDAGSAGDAVALLDAAVGRLPGEGRLLIQLAYALDRAGSPARAREVLARLSPAADDPTGDGSPRHRYNRWPDVDLMRPDSPLQQAGMVRLPALGGALAAMPETGRLEDWTARQREEVR
jgi:tetratricopeptide (TPR) repeat protein